MDETRVCNVWQQWMEDWRRESWEKKLLHFTVTSQFGEKRAKARSDGLMGHVCTWLQIPATFQWPGQLRRQWHTGQVSTSQINSSPIESKNTSSAAWWFLMVQSGSERIINFSVVIVSTNRNKNQHQIYLQKSVHKSVFFPFVSTTNVFIHFPSPLIQNSKSLGLAGASPGCLRVLEGHTNWTSRQFMSRTHNHSTLRGGSEAAVSHRTTIATSPGGSN